MTLTVVIHIVEYRAVGVLREESFDLVLEHVLAFHADVLQTVNVVVGVEERQVYVLDEILVNLDVLQHFVHFVALD